MYPCIKSELFRSDVFVSGAVFAGILGSFLGYPFLDPLAGLLVSGVILKQVYTVWGDLSLF
jgi:divalent metal cation (Fe/Co/Zn/Cd) transporter